MLGEIVSIEGTRIRVRLASGTIGFVEASATSQVPSGLAVGQTGKFSVEHPVEDGETTLCLISLEETEAPHSFESDVHRLQTALNHHHAAPLSSHEAIVPTMDEQRIQQWLQRVEQRLEQLRRNRTKRLDEEFYSGS